MIMRLRWHLALGLAAFLSGALLQAPAALMYHWSKSKDKPAPVELLGVQGSLQHGSAVGVAVNGRPALGGLSWELHPLWLLLANLSAQIRAEAAQTVLESQLSLAPGGRVGAHHLNFSGSVKALLTASGQPFMPLDGMARIENASIKLKLGWPTRAEGLVQVQGLAWTLAANPISLGDFQAELGTDADVITAKISAVSGPLELSGDMLLKPDRSYAMDLKFRPKPEATPVLRNLLASNGAPDASGYWHLKQQGQAPAPP